METAQPPLTILPILDCSMLEKFSLDSSQKDSCINLYLLSLVLPQPDTILSKNLPAPSSRQLSGPCEVTSSPCWISPIPLASVHRANAPAPDHLGGPPLNSLQFTNVFMLGHGGCHWMWWCRCITSLDLQVMFQSSDVYEIPHCFPIYYLLAVFLFNTVSLPLIFHVPTALLKVPGNPSTIGKNEGILCPETGKELFAPFSFIYILYTH